jgi:hypothetical protein
MALDPRYKADHEYNVMHWSSKLPTHIKIYNWAQPGASNTLILRQLQNALLQETFDGISLGFTGVCRLEVDEKITTVHPWITQEQKELDKLYRKNINLTIEVVRNTAIVECALLLAQKHAHTVFSLNGLDDFLIHEDYDTVPKIINLRDEQMPMLLTGHREFGDPPEKNSPRPWISFHVADPEVHINYANQVAKCLDQLHNNPV